MKKKLMVLCLSTVATTAFAQSKNFEGFNIGLGLDATQTNFKTNTSITGNDFKTGDVLGTASETNDFGTKSKLIPALSLGYNFAINQNLILGLEGKYNLSKGPKSNSNYSLGYLDTPITGISSSIQQKNNWSLAIKPGYVLNDKTMIYAKVSYHNAKSNVTNSITGFPAAIIADDDVDSVSLSQTIKQKGIGFGAGIEYNFTKSVFVRAEIEQIRYKSKDMADPLLTPGIVAGGYFGNQQGLDLQPSVATIKPTSTVGGITIGYRF